MSSYEQMPSRLGNKRILFIDLSIYLYIINLLCFIHSFIHSFINLSIYLFIVKCIRIVGSYIPVIYASIYIQ